MKPEIYDENQYAMFKLLYAAKYLIDSWSDSVMPLDFLRDGESRGFYVIDALFDEKILANVTVFVLLDGDDGQLYWYKDVVFHDYRSFNDHCFKAKDPETYSLYDQQTLGLTFTFVEGAAESFMNTFLTKWKHNLFARRDNPFSSVIKQCSDFLDVTYDILAQKPPNNFYFDQMEFPWSSYDKYSLLFCIVAFLHMSGYLSVLSVGRNSARHLLFHLMINPAFTNTFGKSSSQFRSFCRDENFWTEIFDTDSAYMFEFNGRVLAFKGKGKTINQGKFPSALLNYAREKHLTRVNIDDFLGSYSVELGIRDVDGFNKKITAFRTNIKKFFNLPDGVMLFPTKNRLVDLTNVKMRG